MKRFSYWALFRSLLAISALTFGGGFVIIALMRRKFVEEFGWLEEQELLGMTAMSQSAPGPIAVNAAIILGHHLGGIRGALVAIAGSVLPPLVLLSALSFGYSALKTNELIASILRALQAAVGAIIADFALDMGWKVLKEKRALHISMMVAAFACTYFFGINVVWIIFACALIGASISLISLKGGR